MKKKLLSSFQSDKGSRLTYLAFIVILIATYLLTPRFWEPGGESWKYWSVAKIARETGGFPVLSYGPFYVAYLQLFLFLDYPYSQQLEYFITHIFTYLSIFWLLRKVVNDIPALLLTCAWIPMISLVEGGATVAGIGMFALYLSRSKQYVANREYFPIPIFLAALCHSGYTLFLGGHVLFMVYEKFISKKKPVAVISPNGTKFIFTSAVKLILAGLIVITVLFPSKRTDHNHMQMDKVYSPVPLINPLTIGFIQIGNWKYIERQNLTDSVKIYKDWYLTNKEAFGGANTLFEAFVNKPNTAFLNVWENVGPAAELPIIFLAGRTFGGTTAIIFSWMICIIGFTGLFRYLKLSGLSAVILSIVLGTLGMLAALLLTWISRRYLMVMLPVGVLVTAYVGFGLHWLAGCMNAAPADTMDDQSERKSSVLNYGRLFALLMILAALTDLLISRTFPEVTNSPSEQIKVWFELLFDLLLMLTGVTLFYKKYYFSGLLLWIKKKDPKNLSNIFVVISAFLVLLAGSSFFKSRSDQLKGILHNTALLSGSNTLSMHSAYKELLRGLKKDTRVLALENQWINGFTNVKLDLVEQIWTLPPFKDTTGATVRRLAMNFPILRPQLLHRFTCDIYYISIHLLKRR